MSKKIEIKLLSDQEFDEMMKEEERLKFLTELEHASKLANPKKFSVTNMGTLTKKPSIKPKSTNDTDDCAVDLSLTEYKKQHEKIANIDEVEWDDFISGLSDSTMSPIEEIADENISGFRLSSDDEFRDDRYSKVFKKESAMLSEVLKDVKTLTVRIGSQLKTLSTKKTAAVTKNYADLVSSYNQLTSTKIDIIKQLANMKKTQVDWSMKDKKDNPQIELGTDALVDQFYNKIMGAPIQPAMPGIVQTSQETTPQSYQLNDVASMAYREEQPSTTLELDPVTASNIQNEQNNIEVCLYQYGEGQYEFVAVTPEGEYVENYDLPGEDLLATITMKPFSEFAYDVLGRKYRIIDVSEGVDISDIDDMEYPY